MPQLILAKDVTINSSYFSEFQPWINVFFLTPDLKTKWIMQNFPVARLLLEVWPHLNNLSFRLCF